MNIGYIKEADIPEKNIDKIRYFFGKVIVSQFEEGHVLRIPIYKNERKTKKVLYNLIKIIEKLRIDTVVFSEKIMFNHHELYNQIYQALVENKENILNGRKLMNYMNYDIFEYILNLQKVDIKQEDIYFLIKKDPNLDMQFLLRFIENCKTVNIVTNDIDRFKKIQSNLYEKESILISVLNNKSKSLKRAKYIFNVNMTKEEIEKYKINREAIIVNFKEDIRYSNNTFGGINVNYFQIDIPDEYIERFESIGGIEEFDQAKLYESILIRKLEIEKKKNTILSKRELIKRKNIVNDLIKEDNVKITGLMGNNGRIDEDEFINLRLLQNIKKQKNDINDTAKT